MLEYIPEHLDFNVEFEPTKVDDKKYVINNLSIYQSINLSIYQSIPPPPPPAEYALKDE